MLDGKKGVAQKIVYDAFDIIKGKDRQGSFGGIQRRNGNIVMPVLEGKTCRRYLSGSYGSRPERRQTLGLRWLTRYQENAAKRPEGKTWQTSLWTH